MQLRRKCPFCFERTGSIGETSYQRENLSVNPSKRVYFCWRCQAKGPLTDELAARLSVPAHLLGAEDVYDDALSDDDGEEYQKPEDLPEGYEPLFPWGDVKDSVVLAPYLRYLTRRGVSPVVTEHFRLGAVVGCEKKYQNGYIVLPLLDPPRRGYTLRHIRKPWKRNMPDMDRETSLYNGRRLAVWKTRSVYVVEGPFDALTLAPNAVAPLGADVSDAQLARLASYPGPLVIAFDGDAWRKGMILARRLRLAGHVDVHWLRLPPGRDPSAIGAEAVQALPAHA